MMTEADLKPIVDQILDAFPSLDAWFCNLSDEQRQGMRAAWTRQVATLEPSDVQSAADGILCGRTPLPKNYEFDRLGCELRTYGNLAAARRIEEAKSAQLREQARPTGDSSARAVARRFGPSIKCSASWGHAVRDGHTTQSQNDDAMVLIHRHHIHGDVDLPWPEVPATEQRAIVDFWKN